MIPGLGHTCNVYYAQYVFNHAVKMVLHREELCSVSSKRENISAVLCNPSINSLFLSRRISQQPGAAPRSLIHSQYRSSAPHSSREYISHATSRYFSSSGKPFAAESRRSIIPETILSYLSFSSQE